MNDFDFLRDHGYGVVYGEKAVRQKIIDLAIKSPKERTMTYEQATADLELVEVGVAKVTLPHHLYPEVEGNTCEFTDEVGYVTDEGTVAAPADVTIH